MRRILMLFVIAATSLAACNSTADSSPETTEPVVAAATQTATPAPTVSVPTAAPTAVQPTATLTPTLRPATPTPPPTATPQIYVVEEEDTLLGIAVEFDTTVEDLAKANGMSEEDFLQIGQEIVIPASPEAPPPTPTDRATASAKVIGSTTVVTSTAASPAPPQANLTTPAPSNTAQAEVVEDTANDPAAAESVPPPAPAAPVGTPLPGVSHAAGINPLTGLPVDDPAKLQRRPLMVRIGNDVGARQSQVGFNSADMVYEEITEWWVTRFTAIFLSETPNTVGPVRSARLINVQLVPQYQGALAHSGGSDPVRWEISQAPIANLDEYYSPSPYFYRPNQGWQTRLAIDAQAARDYMVAAGLEARVTQQGFQFSDTIDRGEPAENIFIPYPRATSFTQWRYDPASGKYLRWIADQPLVDAGSGQVAADNVIVYFAEHRETDIVEDSNGATSIRIIVNGHGPAWFFRDGRLNKGSWASDGARTPYFTYEDGSPYALKPGNTWVEVVPTYFKIGLNSPDEANSRP